MPTMIEGKIENRFPDTWTVTKYDDWTFYKRHFASSCCGNKAVDFLAYDPTESTLWLLELKDYRSARRTKGEKLWDEIALKVRDTLAGVLAAKMDMAHSEQPFAVQAVQAERLRIVLHLEQPRVHSKLFPRAFDPAHVQLKLKEMLKPIDPHPKVVEIANMQVVPWSAVSLP